MNIPPVIKSYVDRATNLGSREWEYLTSDPARPVLEHGLSILGGTLAGLVFWSLFQTVPVIPEYRYTIEVKAPVIQKQDHAATVKTTEPNADEGIRIPDPALIENIAPYGDLPKIDKANMRRPFDAYRMPFDPQNLSKPLVSFVMMDVGLSSKLSSEIIGSLQPETTVMLSSSGHELSEWGKKARAKKAEVWLELAAEPDDYPKSDAGMNALLTSASIEQNQTSILYQLGKATGYVGLISPYDSPYFQTGADADFLAGSIFERGLGLVIHTSEDIPALKSESVTQNIPFYTDDILTLSPEYDDAKARKIVTDRLSQKGYAVVFVPPSATSIKLYKNLSSALIDQGVALAPLSAIAIHARNGK